ncbi:MAG: hypothetical protein AAF604_01475 [Acidobacteriota bacterium]
MATFHWQLWIQLALPLLLALGACELLARLLRRPLSAGARLLGFLLPWLLLAPWLVGDHLLAPTDVLRWLPDAPRVEASPRHDLLNDAVYQFLPWELEVRHALAERRLPLWSDLLDGGSSPWANPQAGVFSPIHNLARAVPIQHFLLVMLGLKVLIAALGTWVLARLVGVRSPAALIAATGFALSGGLMAWSLFPHTATVAWVPWLAAATLRLVRRPVRRNLVVAALVAAVTLLSGHPETAFAGAGLAAVVGLALAPADRLRRRRGLIAVGLACGLGLALAAVHLVPFAEVLSHSQRADETLARRLPTSALGASLKTAGFVPEAVSFLRAPSHPRAFGWPYAEPFRGPINWVDACSGYAGLVAWAGAWLALFVGPRRRLVPWLGFVGLAYLLTARFVPLALLLELVPALRSPAWSRFLLVACLALNVAAALGIDSLARRTQSRWRQSRRHWSRRPWPRPALAFGLAAAVSLLLQPDGWGLLLWLSLAAAGALLLVQPRLAAWALAAVVLLDLVPWARSHLPRGQSALFYPRTGLVETLADATGEGRVVGGDRLAYPALLSVYDLGDVRSHNPLADVRQLAVLEAAFGFSPSTEEYFAPFSNLDHPLLDFLGVRGALLSLGVPRPDGLRQFDDGRFYPFFVFSNPEALPEAFFPAAVEVLPRQDLPAWVRDLERADRVALLQREAGGWQPTPGPRPVVEVVEERRGYRRLQWSPGAEDRLLATSLRGPDGWRARTSEGRLLDTLTVNGAFLGLRIPPGVGAVELHYRPSGIGVGGAFTGLAALLLGALAAGPGRRRRS